MSKVIPYEKGHILLAEFDLNDRIGYALLDDGISRIEQLALLGESITLLVGGKIICFAGVVHLWPGVCEVWVTPTKYVKEYSFTFVRTMKRYLKVLPETFKCHRIQTTSKADLKYDTWMTKLGFECEGVLRNYIRVGEDYKLWSRLING